MQPPESWANAKFNEYLYHFEHQRADTLKSSDYIQLLMVADAHFYHYVHREAEWALYGSTPFPSLNGVSHPSYEQTVSPFQWRAPIPHIGDNFPPPPPPPPLSHENNDYAWLTENNPHIPLREPHPTSEPTKADATGVPAPTPPPIPITKKIVIDQDIASLQDLIHVIDHHPHVPGVEANIDLEALHKIQHELREINAMIGLHTFKDALLDQLLYFMQGLHINREHDFKHMVIYGPPGSGKTQVAKLVGTMFSKLNLLKNNVFRKVTRSDLVAAYLGQTAIKTNKVIQECLGGCLFIDEVYSLGCGGRNDDGDSFSKECIDTLCEALSDHKDDLMVIVAGYEKDVQNSFFGMNPGLASRFIWRFTVEEYTAEELMHIFIQKMEHNGWQGDDLPMSALKDWFKSHKKDFAYFGRDMELLFTYTKIAHGRRIFGQSPELRKKLTMADVEKGHKQFLKNGDKALNSHAIPESCMGLYL